MIKAAGRILFAALLCLWGAGSAFVYAADEAAEKEPQTAQEYYERGMKALAEEDYETGIPYLEKARDLSPGVAQLHNAVGIAYLQQQENPDAAVNAFQEAVRLDPNLADAYNNLGIVYTGMLEDYDLAEEYFREAIRVQPNFSRAYFGLGWLNLTKKKQAEAAVENFEKVLELSPDTVEAYYYLGIAYIVTDHKPRALMPITILKSKGKEDFAKAIEMMMQEDSAVVRAKIFGEEPESGSDTQASAAPAEESSGSASMVQL